MHLVFHVSILVKYAPDELHKLQFEKLNVLPDLSYEESIQILDRSMKTLCRKVTSLKEHWSRQGVEEVTWEHEGEMRRCFPRLLKVEDSNTRY